MHLFDQDISLITQEPFLFKADVSDNWLVNGIPNGGYIMALLANAMLQNSDKKETPILTANYISRCACGKADLSTETISQSKQFNRMQAKLSQGGTERVRAFGTFAVKKDECFIEKIEASAPDISPLDKCIAIPKFQNYTLFSNMDIRLEPECIRWIEGRLSDKSLQKGWVKFNDDRAFDIFSIALIADSFPPAIFTSQGMIAWVPTIEFSVNIRSIPETKWLKCIFRTRFINCGLLEEDGEVWDENDNLVAISRQIAQFREVSA
ncbi:MAG: thioesterase family protein [Desulfobacteraceae bacterium]|nr:thioesterase family protein [Desulfobacteraceae bacterium]